MVISDPTPPEKPFVGEETERTASIEQPTEKQGQAEGERDRSDGPQEEVGVARATAKPSQAEGDRETIEADLEEKGK